jgi:hypothetical protein
MSFVTWKEKRPKPQDKKWVTAKFLLTMQLLLSERRLAHQTLYSKIMMQFHEIFIRLQKQQGWHSSLDTRAVPRDPAEKVVKISRIRDWLDEAHNLLMLPWLFPSVYSTGRIPQLRSEFLLN